jgi:hypothetical protein
MNISNIITDHSIPVDNASPEPIGLVNTDFFGSPAEVFDQAVKIGNDLGADWIVGFILQNDQAKFRTDFTWKGFGTAVRLKP